MNMKFKNGDLVKIMTGVYANRIGNIMGSTYTMESIKGKISESKNYTVKLLSDKVIQVSENNLELSVDNKIYRKTDNAGAKPLPLSPFKIGDKVALPTTKSVGYDINNCGVNKYAKTRKCEYLYVVDIIKDIVIDDIKYRRVFVLNSIKSTRDGAYYLLKDLKPYIEKPKPIVIQYTIDEILKWIAPANVISGHAMEYYQPKLNIIVTYDGDKTTCVINNKYKGVAVKEKGDKYIKEFGFNVAFVKAMIEFYKDNLANLREIKL
jgi:hypothetical protein